MSPKYDEYNQAMSSFKFFFVRHPFERLVSCYRDKFEMGRKTDYIFRTFNPSIIDSQNKGGERPSFQEFVHYLINTPVEEYNDHWLPNWIHCQTCTQDYDLIGYMETLMTDVSYIFNMSGIKDEQFPWSNAAASGDYNKELTKKYFATLTIEQRKLLYDIYLPDFLMFGYNDAEEYIS